MNNSALTDTVIAAAIIYVTCFLAKKCSEEFYLASADKMYQVGRDLIFLPEKSRLSHSCDCSENILVA